MGQPDRFLRLLTRNLKIVADILNFVLYGGEDRIQPEDLVLLPESQTFVDSNDELRELRRDSMILWRNGNMIFCFIGLESQTYIDPDMPLRGFAYDGESYKEQILKDPNGRRYPVITFVLYYGDKPWTKNLTLRERLNIPNEFAVVVDPYFNDYHVNVIDVPRLTLEDAKKLRSVLAFMASVYRMFEQHIEDAPLPPCRTLKNVFRRAIPENVFPNGGYELDLV